MFIALNLFKTELISAMAVGDTTLAISTSEAAKICDAFGDECIPCDDPITGVDFTRLVISYSGYHEIVKVVGCTGGIVNIVRGDEGTAPIELPVGACVQFVWTAANLECAIIQVASGIPLSIYAGCGVIDLGAGVPGPQGDQGIQGIQGVDGPAGATGATGATGSQGVAGPAGPSGANGLNGLDGAQGVAGPSGAAGTDGAQGVVGPAGPQGADGATGPQGVAGTDGASAYDFYTAGGGLQTEAQFAICLNDTCPPAP